MRTHRQVTDFEPGVAAYLAKHRERLIAPEAPRGLWVCEEDGEIVIALTVYTEPYVRVSAIVDDPTMKPFQSLSRLAESFEAWAMETGIGRYCVVIHKGDDAYCRIIERRGGIVLRETPEWIEYLHEIDQTPDTSEGIRAWRPSDWKGLRAVVSDSLHDPKGLGASFQATRKNTETIIRMGVRAAAKGDPCLIAYENGAIAGYTLWFGFVGPLELRERVCSATAIHTRAGASSDLARRLHEAALGVAWTAGYTRVDGMLFAPEQLGEWKAVGATVPGVIARITSPIEERKVA